MLESSLPGLIFTEQQQPPQRRRKRAQVARACNSCRIRRIKCDNNSPCSNCVNHGGHCSKEGAQSSFTLSQAHKEIASLREKIAQLESELQSRPARGVSSVPNNSTSIFVPSTTVTHQEIKHSGTVRHSWGGVHFWPARSSNSLWLGPSSLYAYIQRLSTFLSVKLNQVQPPHQMMPDTASDNRLLDRPTAGPVSSFLPSSSTTSANGVYLTPMQEDFFLNYFWQTYHVSLCTILNEADFKAHYQSLLISGGTDRKPSALVDIVVAACMQYHISTLPSGSQGMLVEGKDALVAGRWHYWRGQHLLTYELESPSISTLQCHILCAIYLCGGSFHNMMDSAVGLALRTAYTLGLHVDPPNHLPESDRELRKRLWWAVYFMDTRANMKLGRPFMLTDADPGHGMPDLPSDSHHAASISGSTFVPVAKNTTWLSFNLYQINLYRVIRAAYTAFFSTDFNLTKDQTIWDVPEALQAGAAILAQHAPNLETWRNSVPAALTLQRSDKTIKPFSIHTTGITLERFAPLWLQRQRVLLEHTYHHVCINLFRPMISLTFRHAHAARAGDSLPDSLAARCASHAIALTNLSHQVLSETSIFDGWHEAFYCQWNAVMTLIGFVIVYNDGDGSTLIPVNDPSSSPSTPATTNIVSDVKTAIRLAITVFDNFGAKFAVAASAARIVRGLCVKTGILADAHATTTSSISPSDPQNLSACPELLQPMLWGDMSMRTGNTTTTTTTTGSGSSSSTTSPSLIQTPVYADGNTIAMNDPLFGEMNGQSELDLLDMAFDIDFWNKVDVLWPGDEVESVGAV
ncbi:fungal-specific transcription factor domain-containing protein [Aspergillus heterothallicus]